MPGNSWKLSSLTKEFISEVKTQIEGKIANLSKKVTKCVYSFETYFSSVLIDSKVEPLKDDILVISKAN